MFIAKYREDIRVTIPAMAEHLKSSIWDIGWAATEGYPTLAGQGMC